MAFRILNQAPQYLLASGKVNAGGSLHFFETDLSTPKDTWSDEALTVLNSNPVLMDSAGRTVTDVWGDGEYGVVMSDRIGVEIWTRNDVRADAGAGNLIPALVAGQFLTNDGSILQWQPILQLPDPTGLANFYLVSDGEQANWEQIPEPPEPVDPEIVVTANSFQAGVSDDTTKKFEQTGSASAPASGTPTTTVSVVFPVAFATCTYVGLTLTSNSQPGGPVVHNLTALSATGFTMQADVAEASGSGSPDIVNAVPFIWYATGTRTVA